MESPTAGATLKLPSMRWGLLALLVAALLGQATNSLADAVAGPIYCRASNSYIQNIQPRLPGSTPGIVHSLRHS